MNKKIIPGLAAMILAVSIALVSAANILNSGEIPITKASHLDKNYNFISGIYKSVWLKDNIWSEKIHHNEIVRVKFIHPLSNRGDITLFARNIEGKNTIVEVYYYNSNKKITTFPIIDKEKYYKVLLTELIGTYDTFDLKIKNLDNDKNAYLEFDHIVDPACTVTDDSIIAHNGADYNTTGQFNVSVQFTCASAGATRTAHFDLSLDYGTNTSAATSEATTNLTSSCVGNDFKFISAEFAGSCDNLANVGCTDANSDGTITIDITNDPVTAVVNWTVEICEGISGSFDFDSKATSVTDGLITFDEFVEIRVTNNDTTKPRINASIYNASAPTKGDVINFTANVSDNAALDTCQFFMNGTSDGSFIILNKSVTGTNDQCSQNWTIDLIRGNVINFTALVNDTNNNINQSTNRSDGGAYVVGQIIEVSNFIPTPTIVFPTNDLKTNSQPLDLNVTYEADRDNDVINISYYINGVLNQTQLGLNTTFNASDGIYVLNVSLFDNVTGTSYSANATVNFTIDTVKPSVNLSSPVTMFNSSSENVTFIFNATDERSTQNINCSIYIDSVLNATNSSTLNATPTSFKINNFNEGVFFWNVICLDEAQNSNTSETRNFTVDLRAPIINKISLWPNSTDDVDPNVLLNFTINATDNTSVTNNISEVKTVVLQYKQSGAGTFTNATAQFNSGSGLYNASFTPDVADTWSYRIYVSDYAGNNDSSGTQSISVENDRTWNRLPSTFDNLACGLSNTCVAGNLTINNTGDFTMNFDLSSNFGATSYNITEPFDLAAKGVRVVRVSLTAGSSAAESNVVITTDATTSNADPDSDTTNFTFTASIGGPVFDLTIINPPTEANKSDPGVIYLNASLKNIGNETAGQTWINWTLPSNWLNISGTNLTKNISGISVNEIVYHNITVNLTSDAATGTQTVIVRAASNNSASDNATASIVVTETSSVTTVTTTTTTGGGGGGGSSGGGGGGSIVNIAQKPEEIEISQIIDLVRGGENTFTIDVTNTYEGSVLNDLVLQVEGFLSQYLTITPATITGLGYQQTKSFVVTVAAPEYKGYEEHTLKALVTGMLVKTEMLGNVTTTTKNPFTLKDYISLIVHEISKEDADASLQDAIRLIEEMQQSGFPAKKALKLFEEAKDKLGSRRYQLAKDITGQISSIRDNAFSANILIYDLKQKIYDAEKKGLSAEETKRLLNLAIAAFEREDFLTAIKRAKDAGLSIVIETKGKINILKFIIDYWWPLLVLLIIISITGYFARKKLILIIIARRLQDLQKEEITINELMQETQEKYYKDKKINTTEYHKSMYGYEKRLGEVSESISRLRSKRVGIIEISNEIRNLEKEDQNVVSLLKGLQEDYFNKQTITRKVYLKRVEQYKLRRIEIERSIAVLEAKLAKKEKLEEQKAKETSKTDIISSIKKKEDNFKKQPPISPKAKPKKRFGFGNLFNTKKKKEGFDEVKNIIDDLVKRKESVKPIFPNLRIKSIQNKILGEKKAVKPEETINKSPIENAIKPSLMINNVKQPLIKNSIEDPVKNPIKKPIEKTIKKPLEIRAAKKPSMFESIKKAVQRAGKKQGKLAASKKEIISKLKDKFQLDAAKLKPKISVKPKSKGYKKHFSSDADALREHGFKIKVPGEKEPKPTYVMPKPGSHTKHSILNHFKEVYKHG